MSDLVHKNLSQAQYKQKQWYDKNARERKFSAGDQVLVLLPTDTNKLLAQWQGPYKIVKQIGKVNYQVELHDRRKHHRIFHVNMLRPWYTATSNSYLSTEVTEDDQDDIPLWYPSDSNQLVESQPTLGAQLSPLQQESLKEMLKNYPEVVQDKPGCTDWAIHSVSTGDKGPIRLPPYRLPYAYRESVKMEIEDMLKHGIIEPSTSEWSAPIVVVQKKDKSLRICVDYRRLNSLSEMDAYPMPRIDEVIDRLGAASFISTMDLNRGYWQVPLSPESKTKTAFATPFGLYQFNVMPFGLQGAPATFQRLMDKVVRGMEQFTAAYLDDLIIYSESWEDHLNHISQVLQRLREAGLTVKAKKCQLGMRECIYLGHVVGNGTVKPEPGKIEAVQRFPVPQTKKQVRAFLGLAGYYRRFIPNFSSIAVPLTNLTKKSNSSKISWSQQCTLAFEKLKDALCSVPVLRSPNFELPFILQTDASDCGIGGVLSQCDENNEEHPVAYFSRKLLPREQRYSTVEKECLAIRLSVEAFKVYLLGKHFKIQTDHRALVWLDQLKDKNARLTRWSLALQPYNFTVIHRKGKDNDNADVLSRYMNDSILTSKDLYSRVDKLDAGEGGRSVTGESSDIPTM